MRSYRVKIELHHFEFKALKANSMISGMCSSYLASAKRQGDYIVLDISILEAKDLAACDAIELQLYQ